FEESVAALNIGARLEVAPVNRSGIAATKVDVFAGEEKELPREVFWEQQGHTHTHAHKHEQPHEHAELREHNCNQTRSEPTRAGASAPHHHEHGRGLKEIRELIG